MGHQTHHGVIKLMRRRSVQERRAVEGNGPVSEPGGSALLPSGRPPPPPPPPSRHHRPSAGLPRWGTPRPQWSQPPTPPLHCTPWHDWVPALLFPCTRLCSHSLRHSLTHCHSPAARLLFRPPPLSLSPGTRGEERRGDGVVDPSLAACPGGWLRPVRPTVCAPLTFLMGSRWLLRFSQAVHRHGGVQR
jgi:hypothetical protein